MTQVSSSFDLVTKTSIYVPCPDGQKQIENYRHKQGYVDRQIILETSLSKDVFKVNVICHHKDPGSKGCEMFRSAVGGIVPRDADVHPGRDPGLSGLVVEVAARCPSAEVVDLLEPEDLIPGDHPAIADEGVVEFQAHIHHREIPAACPIPDIVLKDFPLEEF